jgi:hypothetical protein
VIAVLVGCASPPGSSPSPTPTETLAESLRKLPGILEVNEHSSGLTVVIPAVSSDDDVFSAATAVAGLAGERAWDGTVRLSREPGGYDAATDTNTPSPWSTEVYPAAPDEVAATLADLLQIERVPGIVMVSLDDWPTVAIGSLDGFAAAFRTLSDHPRFVDGATYTYYGESPRLIIVHIAERMTSEAIEAVIRIAVEHPSAEVELQSMTSGPRWPELYVSHLTPEEVVAVEAQLRDPALADADREGYSVPFQLSYLDSGGPVYSFGTFGDVPDTSS